MFVYCRSDTLSPNLLETTKEHFLNLPHSGPVLISPRTFWNGNSTPWGFWNVIPPFKYPLASLFHDELCKKAKNNEERKKADKDYRWILKTFYGCKGRAFLGYFGVSLGRLKRRFTGY